MTAMNRRHNDAGSREALVTKINSERSELELRDDDKVVVSWRLSQPMLRLITVIIGSTAILSNSIYGLFAPKFLNFQQPQLSATYSTAAALMVLSQVVFPKIVSRIGEHMTCTVGILAAGAGAKVRGGQRNESFYILTGLASFATGIGGMSLIRVQPFHTVLYMLQRTGAAVADTSTAALVASSSTTRFER